MFSLCLSHLVDCVPRASTSPFTSKPINLELPSTLSREFQQILIKITSSICTAPLAYSRNLMVHDLHQSTVLSFLAYQRPGTSGGLFSGLCTLFTLRKALLFLFKMSRFTLPLYIPIVTKPHIMVNYSMPVVVEPTKSMLSVILMSYLTIGIVGLEPTSLGATERLLPFIHIPNLSCLQPRKQKGCNLTIYTTPFWMSRTPHVYVTFLGVILVIYYPLGRYVYLTPETSLFPTEPAGLEPTIY